MAMSIVLIVLLNFYMCRLFTQYLIFYLATNYVWYVFWMWGIFEVSRWLANSVNRSHDVGIQDGYQTEGSTNNGSATSNFELWELLDIASRLIDSLNTTGDRTSEPKMTTKQKIVVIMVQLSLILHCGLWGYPKGWVD